MTESVVYCMSTVVIVKKCSKYVEQFNNAIKFFKCCLYNYSSVEFSRQSLEFTACQQWSKL